MVVQHTEVSLVPHDPSVNLLPDLGTPKSESIERSDSKLLGNDPLGRTACLSHVLRHLRRDNAGGSWAANVFSRPTFTGNETGAALAAAPLGTKFRYL
jgi:hypothetical protein